MKFLLSQEHDSSSRRQREGLERNVEWEGNRSVEKGEVGRSVGGQSKKKA